MNHRGWSVGKLPAWGGWERGGLGMGGGDEKLKPVLSARNFSLKLQAYHHENTPI